MNQLPDIFLDFSMRKLRLLASRIDDCLGRLDDEKVWSRSGENVNAVGNLVLHLCGNVRQWVVSGIGGAKDIRERDAEFAARETVSSAELRLLLEQTTQQAASIIESLPGGRLPEKLTIQGYHVTVFEAIYTVVEHFAQHTGQIIFATKLLTGLDLGFYAHLSKSSHTERTP